MLYLCDLDGTLITSYMDNPGRDYHVWQPLPGRGLKIRALRRAGHTVGVVSNQGGVAFGKITEADWEQKIGEVCAWLGIDWEAVYVCFADARSSDLRYNDPREVRRRKPSGAMIVEAMQRWGYGFEQTVFIGDRTEDQQAAADAGVRFQWADQFFGGK